MREYNEKLFLQSYKDKLQLLDIKDVLMEVVELTMLIAIGKRLAYKTCLH